MLAMHPHQYPDELFSWRLDQSATGITERLKTQSIAAAAKAFDENTASTRALAAFPQDLIQICQQVLMVDAAASQVVFGHPFPGLFNTVKFTATPEQEAAFLAERSAIIERKRAVFPNFIELEINGALNFLRWACNRDENPTVRRAVSSFLSAILLQTWTAIEVLMTDLWVGALNGNPFTLAKNAISRIDKSPAGKSVELRLLEEYDFDLREKMGSLAKHKFDFDRFDGIQEAYAKAFKCPKVDALFNQSDKDFADVSVLEAIRNLIAHRSGRVDSKFRIQVSKCVGSSFIHLKDATEGVPIPLDSVLVRELFNSVSRFGVKLITIADNEIEAL